ncbi:protein delta homolog 2 [Sinocyclocheilus rhinocerous]|uniref:protein delta homolog 2 n=1 Tax=Sinocyclocheilus rhinocerous TaxID=307959 RepID=UPI0007B94842|nr:PREDICTED: protein delta homolog 2 [Sinocyclocheilus rhinocerous]
MLNVLFSSVLFSSVETSPTPSASNCTCELGLGKCAETGDCRCDPGWGGPRCEDCVRMPGCVHGTCHQPWQCTCMDGWAGRFCDKDIYVCSREQPCQNGATCVLNDSGDYSCLCPEGFHGRDCELKTGPCQKTKGEGDRVTLSKPAPVNRSHGTTPSGDERRSFKISVVTQHGAEGLSELQLIILLVLGGMTLAVVVLTAGLVLRGHCQDRSARCQCRRAPVHHRPFHRCRTNPVPMQQECKISFLQSPAPTELEKKRLNTDII